jgi:hypothetical protein
MHLHRMPLHNPNIPRDIVQNRFSHIPCIDIDEIGPLCVVTDVVQHAATVLLGNTV